MPGESHRIEAPTEEQDARRKGPTRDTPGGAYTPVNEPGRRQESEGVSEVVVGRRIPPLEALRSIR